MPPTKSKTRKTKPTPEYFEIAWTCKFNFSEHLVTSFDETKVGFLEEAYQKYLDGYSSLRYYSIEYLNSEGKLLEAKIDFKKMILGWEVTLPTGESIFMEDPLTRTVKEVY